MYDSYEILAGTRPNEQNQSYKVMDDVCTIIGTKRYYMDCFVLETDVRAYDVFMSDTW